MEYSRADLLAEIAKHIAISGEQFRNDFYDYVTQTVGLSNQQASSIMQGGTLEKFSDKVLAQIAEYMAPYLSPLAQEVSSCFYMSNADIEAMAIRKKKFLSEIDGNFMRKIASASFTHLRLFEEKTGRDICTATKQEMIDAISESKISNTRTLQNMLSAIKKYCLWCSNNGISVPHLEEINTIVPTDINLGKAVASKYLSGPEELDHILDSTIRGIDHRGAVLCILAWLGFNFTEMSELQDKDVNLREKSIVNDYFGVINIPECLVKYFSEYEACMYSRDNNPKEITSNYIKRFEGKYILEKEFMQPGSIRQCLSQTNAVIRKLKNTTYDLQYKGLMTSGAAWRLMQLEMAGQKIDDDQIAYYARIPLANRNQRRSWKEMYQAYKKMYWR